MSKYIFSFCTISSPKSGQVLGFYENCKCSRLRSYWELDHPSLLPFSRLPAGWQAPLQNPQKGIIRKKSPRSHQGTPPGILSLSHWPQADCLLVSTLEKLPIRNYPGMIREPLRNTPRIESSGIIKESSKNYPGTFKESSKNDRGIQLPAGEHPQLVQSQSFNKLN